MTTLNPLPPVEEQPIASVAPALANEEDWFKPCALIPVYNHERSLPAVVAALRAADLPCVLVDDGSSPAAATVIDRLAEQDGVFLLRHPRNQGKGGAVICGYPRYDASVPKGRLYARYLTHVWVWINTLSLAIRDSMCGFRVYPLEPTLALLDRVRLGRRMDFDTEILVRLHWQEQPMVWLPTRVHYPADGVSHFRLWLDNALISAMHARLFCGMLLRAPKLLARRLQR